MKRIWDAAKTQWAKLLRSRPLASVSKKTAKKVPEHKRREAFFRALERADVAAVRAMLGEFPGKARWVGGMGQTALTFAIRRSSAECVAALIPHSDLSKANSQGRNALMIAATENQLEVLELLLPHMDANLKDKTHYTALMLASDLGHLKCLKALIPHCDANARDAAGNTALMIAVRAGSLECVRALLPASDPHLQKEGGYTALMIAANYGRSEILALILPSSANLPDDDGRVALVHACGSGESACVEALLPHTDLFAKNENGATTREMIGCVASSEIVELVDAWYAAREREALETELEIEQPVVEEPKPRRSSRL